MQERGLEQETVIATIHAPRDATGISTRRLKEYFHSWHQRQELTLCHKHFAKFSFPDADFYFSLTLERNYDCFQILLATLPMLKCIG